MHEAHHVDPARAGVGAVVLAAGDGQRLGKGPKALVTLAGRPLLAWTIESMLTNRRVRDVVVVANPRALPASVDVAAAFAGRTPVRVVAGGATRQESAMAGLAAVPPELRYAALTDAARPLTAARTVDGLLARLLATPQANAAGVVPGLPLFDTIHLTRSGGDVTDTVDRETLRAAQTPQLFCRMCLEQAYQNAADTGVTGTDDAALVARFGARVLVAPGDPRNFKITTDWDLSLAEALVAGGR